MRGNRSVGTKPEARVRSAVHQLGLRFRKDYRIKVGGPRGIRTDLAFPRLRVAVFVDGCFWHGCPEHGHIPSTNHDYWSDKLLGNVERDTRNRLTLEEAGWTVVRVWEHDDVEATAARIHDAVEKAKDRLA